MNPVPTDEQEAAIRVTREGTESLLLDALAGTGKTTTLAMLASECRGPSLALAFNKSIAEEMKKRFPPTFDVKTLNGLGFGVLRREHPGVSAWAIDGRKLGKIINEQAKARRAKISTEEWDAVRRIVTGAQLAGIVPGRSDGITPDSAEAWQDIASDLLIDEGDIEPLCEIAYATLVESNNAIARGEISFDDQVYWPVAFGAQFPRYGRVLVDEAQDLNRLNHAALERTSGGWLGVCGDPRQSIYGFRGSVNDSMGKIKGLKPKWNDLGLTLTFRCPKEIVRRQHEHAPKYRAHQANPDGRVLTWKSWSWDKLWTTGLGDSPARPDIAVLCRNNAPLLSLAFKLLRQRVSVRVVGRDIGKGLESIVKKLSPDLGTPLTEFLVKLHKWADEECSLAVANGHEEKVDAIQDRRECFVALSDPSVRSTGDLLKVLRELFSDEQGTAVTLSSVHKAKGLEWTTVLHLDPWRCPAKRARGKPTEWQQELNLKYVLETRTKLTLIEAELKDFDGEAE